VSFINPRLDKLWPRKFPRVSFGRVASFRRPTSTLILLAAVSSLAAACALIADLGDRQLGEPRADGGELGDATLADGPATGDGGGGDCTQTPLPLSTPEMMLLLDLSGSMGTEPRDGGPTRFEIEKSGVTAFVEDPQTRAMSAGLAYHPANQNARCNPAEHRVPVVALGPVEGDAGTGRAIAVSLATLPRRLSGSSFWWAGLAGAKTYLGQSIDAGTKPTLVFLADTVPADCGPDGGPESAVHDLQTLPTPVRTYVIGLVEAEDQIALFDRMARAGATDHATAFTTSSPTSAWLSDLLERIRDELRCEVGLPSGTGFDSSINSISMGETKIPAVADAKGCTGDGYYLLHAAGDGGSFEPNGRARLCPQTCAKAVAGTGVVASVCR
jgi:hypothetical protein